HQGRAAIEAGHRHIFATIYKGSRAEYRIERVRFVRPDVAVAFVHARLWSRLAVAVDDPRREAHIGATMSESQPRSILILAKTGDRWQVVAVQHARVAGAGERRTGERPAPLVRRRFRAQRRTVALDRYPRAGGVVSPCSMA